MCNHTRWQATACKMGKKKKKRQKARRGSNAGTAMRDQAGGNDACPDSRAQRPPSRMTQDRAASSPSSGEGELPSPYIRDSPWITMSSGNARCRW